MQTHAIQAHAIQTQVRLLLIVVLGVFLVDVPGLVDQAHGYPRSPSQKNKNNKNNNKNKSKNKNSASSGAPATVSGVSINLRNNFGQIAASKLPQAILDYEAAANRVREAEIYLVKVQREVEISRQGTRTEVAGRVADLRRDAIEVNKNYAEAMLRVQEKLRTNSLYRSVSLQLEKARSNYDVNAALSATSSETLLALGEVSRLEKQLKEMENEAISADQDALNAKTAYDELRQQYKDTQRELIAPPAESGRRQEIADAYQALVVARRDAAAKARIVAEYKSLLHTATYQKPIVGFQLGR